MINYVQISFTFFLFCLTISLCLSFSPIPSHNSLPNYTYQIKSTSDVDRSSLFPTVLSPADSPVQSYATRLNNGSRLLSQPNGYRPIRQSLSLSPIRNKRQLISKETSLSYPNSPIQNEKSLLSFEANSISISNSQSQSPSQSQLQSIDLLRERQSVSHSPPRDRRGTGFICSSDLRPYKNSILGSRSGMISRSRSGVASPLVSSGMYLNMKDYCYVSLY